MWERDRKRDGETRVNIKDSQLNYSPSAISTNLISGWFMQKKCFCSPLFLVKPKQFCFTQEVGIADGINKHWQATFQNQSSLNCHEVNTVYLTEVH